MRRPTGAADPVLLAVLLGTLGLFPLFLSGIGGNAASWTVQTAVDALDIWFAWRLATHPDVPPQARRQSPEPRRGLCRWAPIARWSRRAPAISSSATAPRAR